MTIERYNPAIHLVMGCSPTRGVKPSLLLNGDGVKACFFGSNLSLFDSYPTGDLPDGLVYAATFGITKGGDRPQSRADLRQLLREHKDWYFPDAVDVASLLAFNLAAFRSQMPPKIICAISEDLSTMLVLHGIGLGNQFFQLRQEPFTNVEEDSDYAVMLATREKP